MSCVIYLLLLLESRVRTIPARAIHHCMSFIATRLLSTVHRGALTAVARDISPRVSVGFLVTYPPKCLGFYAMHAQITVGATPPGCSE